MSSQILKEILDAEKEIDAKAEQAKKKAEKMLRDAEASCVKLIDGKKISLEQKNREKLGQLKKDLEEKRKKKLEEAKKKVIEIRKNAEKNSKKAVDYIYSEFLDSLK